MVKALEKLLALTSPRESLSQAELARRLEVSPQYLNNILRARRQPSRAFMARAEAELGITLQDWVSDQGADNG